MSAVVKNGRLRSASGCAFALAAVLAALFATPAGAATAGPGVIVKVHPAAGPASTYFAVTARPGTTVRPGSLQLVNPTAGPVTIRLDPVDSLTTNTLGSAYSLGGPAHGVTSWTTLSSRRVTLPPHGHTNIAVAADVPSSAKPGDYLSGIAVEALGQVSSTPSKHGISIGEIDRYAIGLELRVPGPRSPLIRFTGARVVRDPSQLTFLLLARNLGNVILKNVHGTAVVIRSGHVVAQLPLGPGTFVTGTSIAYPVGARTEEPTVGTKYRVQATLYYAGGVAHLDTQVAFGHAAAVVQQRYGGPGASSSSASSSLLPWVALVILLLGIGGAGFFIFVLAPRRRRAPQGRAAQAHVDRALAGATDDRPVSIVHIRTDQAAERRRAARVVSERMRASDQLCDLDERGLVLVLPTTGAPMAAGFALDLTSALIREGVALPPGALAVATATAPTNLTALMAAYAAPAPRVPA